MTQITIHPTQRKLAGIAFMHEDKKTGRINVEDIPVPLIEESFRANLELVRAVDELKNLSLLVYETGDMEWLHRICKSLEDLNCEKL
ncbi:DUF7667 family protein [Paenibacillus illinoisensis]|uniref:DUF7667 family protein n=1 Tax=Paenibacillus illinoisensis TaxID=59845 RepID=UPI0020400ABD|nr:hypothetical protein [Paenibacillus illinoisensis]MCM3208529.1 hypothetical protein [Paenibacillus illinoisensis]